MTARRVYHGTTGRAVPRILKEGLRSNTWFTPSLRIARHFANLTSRGIRRPGKPVILSIPMSRLNPERLQGGAGAFRHIGEVPVLKGDIRRLRRPVRRVGRAPRSRIRLLNKLSRIRPLVEKFRFHVTDAYARTFTHPVIGKIVRKVVEP